MLQTVELLRSFFIIHMRENRIGYLSPEEQQDVKDWVVKLKPLKERHPVLNKVDLVIEGGVGTGRIMPHVVREFFPNALYVGTDISDILANVKKRQDRAIEENVLKGVLRANEHPSLDMEDAIINGNCFDEELIRDIAQKAGRQYVFLTSFNALTSLMNRNMNIVERKHGSDIVSVEDMVRPNGPYMGQLHVGQTGDFWKEDKLTIIEKDFMRFRQAARTAGWRTDSGIDNGLLILRAA